jgi:hypothetical protein
MLTLYNKEKHRPQVIRIVEETLLVGHNPTQPEVENKKQGQKVGIMPVLNRDKIQATICVYCH